MRYGSRLNAVLFIVLLATFAGAWYLQRDVAGPDVAVAAFSWDDVGTIRIELRDRVPLHFERGPGGWAMTAPLALDADTRRLREIVHALNVPSQARYTTREADPAQLGLADPPVARVVVDGTEFLVGDTNPVSGWRYLQHDGVVHVVHDVLYFRLLGEPQTWADRQPLRPGARVSRIAVDGAELDDDAVPRVAAAWAAAHAHQVRRYTGGGAFEHRVSIWLEGAEAPVEFGLTVTDGGAYAVRTDIQVEYHLPAHGADALWRVPDAG